VLEFSLSQAPFRYGVEEGVDPKQVPFGTLLTAQNVVWVKSGRLQKRQGVTALSTGIVGGGNVSSARRLFVRGSELGLTNGETAYSLTDSGWVSRGRMPEFGLEWSTSLDSVQGLKASDVAYLGNGHVVQAWVIGDPNDLTTGSEVYYQVIERSSGAMVVSPTPITSGAESSRVRIVVTGSTYAILWVDDGDLKSFISETTTTLKTDAASTDPNGRLRESFDACTIGSEFVVAYALDAGGIRLVRYSFAATPVQQATATVTGETSLGIMALSIDGASGETLYIGYGDFQNMEIKFATANPATLAQVVAPTDLGYGITTLTEAWIGIKRVSTTACVMATTYSDGGSTVDHFGIFTTVQITNAGVVGPDGKFSAGLRLLSRPFVVNSRLYALLGTYTTSDTLRHGELIEGSDVYVADITTTDTTPIMPHREVGKVDLLIGGDWFVGHVTNVPEVSPTEFIVVSPFIAEGAKNVGPWRQGTKLVTITSGSSVPEDLWRSVQVGPEVYWASGVETAYDGRNALPYGWAHPSYIDAEHSAGSATGGSIDAGNYLYCTVPERRSAVGVLHRGPPAIPQTITVGGTTNGSVALLVLPVHLSIDSPDTVATQRQRGLIAIHRSVKNGETLHRLTMEPTIATLNNTAATGFNFGLVDTYDDTSIGSSSITLAERPVLYTDGGELEDFQPPGFVTQCLYRNRIFAIDGSREQVWFTKNYTENQGTAPGFHPQMRLFFNDRLVGLATLDERLFIFSSSGIHYIAGDGPSSAGDGSDYGEPNKLQTDVGCTNARGIVSTPLGVMFVSGNEIHLLERGLSVSWIGKPVQDLLDSFPVVTSAVLVTKKNHVRFTFNASDGLSGIVLVYDYQEKQWSHFVYGDSLPIADAVMHADAYTFVTPSGVVYKESDATWLDDGEWVTAKIETAWVHAAGPLAYHAVRHFRIDGSSSSAHGISIEVGFNGNTTYQQGPKTFAEATAGVTTPGDVATANVRIGTRRKCRSIRFKVEDSAPLVLGTGQGAKWSSMGIEVGVKKGLGRLPPAQRK
jgi:hypothetical protein